MFNDLGIGKKCMVANSYVSLHNHTEYSFIDGLCKIKDLVKAAKSFNMPALSITDHGTLMGLVKFYIECMNQGIKPILGIEAYICPNSLEKKKRNNYHILLLAKNDIGRKNLNMLSTISYEQERYYFNPRIDFDLLDKYGEGLIVSSACILGEIADALLDKAGQDGYNMAKNIASKYKERFGSDYYLELMYHGIERQGIIETSNKVIEQQKYVLEKTLQLSKELNIPTVLTNDTHYVCRDDYSAQQIKKARKFNKKNSDSLEEKDDVDRNEFYLKSPEEFYQTFGNIAFAIEQTLEIANKCDVKLALGAKARPKVPSIDVEQCEDYEAFCRFRNKYQERFKYFDDGSQYIVYLAWKGLVDKGLHTDERYKTRLDYEISVTSKTPFLKYFAVTRDAIQWAWKNNIWTGGGRGSAAGSLMLYCLGITNIDPIVYDLSFERFIAAEKGYVIEKQDLME